MGECLVCNNSEGGQSSCNTVFNGGGCECIVQYCTVLYNTTVLKRLKAKTCFAAARNERNAK